MSTNKELMQRRSNAVPRGTDPPYFCRAGRKLPGLGR